ncbi:HTH-type transcriptional regulator BenM [Pseudoalteromonas holothuriae]|uniref:HTH-type transcriptional regulator BenM n=1 Tax=Pseudoalteromonas holothuriae TaxID=2963714 RepID=A0ABM9GMT1_9GAMM|nr:LysR family transcriptional regulator [Pseudoalteromonas sp. CIP111951]CAH9067427.1 HTH-type transcriptional regulator BenM [Pseudoalteromonas sp. CIP111951]
MIEIKPLRYFVAAYEEGSITAAASRCFIAQPSITHAIKALETTLGVILFERTKQGIKATKQGHMLYTLACDLLLQNQQLHAAFVPSNKTELYLYVQPDINIEHYANIILSIQQVDNNISLSIASSVEQSQLAIIDEQRLPTQFNSTELNQECYQLLVRHDHKLAKNKRVTLNDFKSLTFIERPYCTNRKEFERLIHVNNMLITYKGKAIHDLQLQGLVKLGFGVAVIPQSYIPKDDELATIPIALDTPISRSIVLAYRKLPPQLISFIEQVVSTDGI